MTDELHATPSHAHDFVGADLAAIYREAGMLAFKHFLALAPLPSAESAHLMAADLAASLSTSHRPPIYTARARDYRHSARPLRRHWRAREHLRKPPGCSKMVLVRTTSPESGVNFVAVRGPELLNKYVDFPQGAQRIPIKFFFYWRAQDEIDVLAASRSPATVDTGTHKGVLLSLLNEMDGVEELVSVTIIGATNWPEVLYVGPPDFASRMEILRIHTRHMAIEPALDLDAIAALTSGCSGPEITAIFQEAALITMREDIDAPFRTFVATAKTLKRQITPEMPETLERWKDGYNTAHGVKELHAEKLDSENKYPYVARLRGGGALPMQR
ncbi:P-loop containing nucleoside triphosphate hydrolase protein [Russula compacta]|nr:P-loop containing nucleoside triphosphate hydrolase protein [Russula compacta]